MSDSIESTGTYYPGVTIRFGVKDLLSTQSGPVTSGADVAFEVYDLTGTVHDTGTGVATDDDWYYLVNAPETPGYYRVRATAEVGSEVWKEIGAFIVEPFV